ncbi:unnamed protein product [Dracunculus medinensis]|uniref:Vps54_N domain-containing protein n=1 Tax=Dracunculus medinensis TaxID=318479 RepID=A0A0N4UF26_DRAME|nr:unnamed protein product [Dracunculus medinensis]
MSFQLRHFSDYGLQMESIDNLSVYDSSFLEQMTAVPKLQTRCLPVTDPVKEAEIIESIAAAYFVEEDFDATNYELKKLLNLELLPEDLMREMDLLKRQLQVVSKRISSMIIANSVSYSTQLKNIDGIHDDLTSLIQTIAEIRRNIGLIKSENRNKLKILANHRNRKFLHRLKSSLNAIRTLYETEFQLKDLIQEENFFAAIRLYNEARKAAFTYNHFKCIRDLMEKLSETMHEIEYGLDNALASLTVIFDPDRYSSIFSAYEMLNRTTEAATKIINFTHATIENSSRTVISNFLIHRIADNELNNLSYEQLCENVCTDSTLDCVRELGFVVCKILFTFHLIMRYHVDDDERLQCTDENKDEIRSAQKILRNSAHSIFKTACMKYNILLCCQDLSTLNFDHFLDIVDMSARFRHFGRKYFGNSCTEVSVTLEKHIHLYFGRYHHDKMEELRMFLESEAFAPCPLPQRFTIFDLQEFAFLKGSLECCDNNDETIFDMNDELNLGEQLDFEVIGDFVQNPFATEADSFSCSRNMANIISNLAIPESNDDWLQESENQLNPPIISNAALNLLRFFGRYIRMTFMLDSVAEQAVASIMQLFDYFFYSLCTLFSADSEGLNLRSERLTKVLSKIEKDIIIVSSSTTEIKLGLAPCTLSSAIRLYDSNCLFALAERIVSVQSLVFIAKHLDIIRPVVESLVKNDIRMSELREFYSSILNLVNDAGCSIYSCVAVKAINYRQLIVRVSSTRWDLNELQSQHSAYVDSLLQDLEAFKKRLEMINEYLPLSKDIINTVWDIVINCSFKALVQGYSESGKKCSSEGRALMQLDLQQLISRIEQICNIHPVPHKAYVENYIKAYYLPESSFEQWIQQHSMPERLRVPGFEYRERQPYR